MIRGVVSTMQHPDAGVEPGESLTMGNELMNDHLQAEGAALREDEIIFPLLENWWEIVANFFLLREKKKKKGSLLRSTPFL